MSLQLKKAESSIHGDDFPKGTRFTNLNFRPNNIETKASQNSESTKGHFQANSPGGGLKSLEKGGSKPESNPKEKQNAFLKSYHQTIRTGQAAAKTDYKSPEFVTSRQEFNKQVKNTLEAAQKLGMSKENLSKLTADLYKPLTQESPVSLPRFQTGQMQVLANRYGLTEVAQKLKVSEQLARRSGILSSINLAYTKKLAS